MRIALCLLLASLTIACQQTAADTRATDEAALKAADESWSRAASAHDVDKTVGFYSDDAIILPPNSPAITGKENMRAMWKAMIEPSGSAISWKVAKVEVAKSGELGYVTGSYEMTDASTAKPINDRGKYLEVWRKQTDGSWKCILDMFSSDLSATSAATSVLKETEPGARNKSRQLF